MFKIIINLYAIYYILYYRKYNKIPKLYKTKGIFLHEYDLMFLEFGIDKVWLPSKDFNNWFKSDRDHYIYCLGVQVANICKIPKIGIVPEHCTNFWLIKVLKVIFK